MAINTINYSNKSDINTTATPATNKVVAADMNEIKTVVNTNANLQGDLSNLLIGDQSSIVNAINSLKDYFTGTILWTNPNPSASDFSAQSITLSSDDYDCYEVIVNWSSSVNRTQSSGKVLKGTGTVFNFVSSVSYYRTLTYVSDTEISVSNATIYNIKDSSSSTGNDWFIPLYVIGYKNSIL